MMCPVGDSRPKFLKLFSISPTVCLTGQVHLHICVSVLPWSRFVCVHLLGSGGSGSSLVLSPTPLPELPVVNCSLTWGLTDLGSGKLLF